MKSGNVYRAIRSAVLSTVICRDFVDKDFWNGPKAELGLLTGLPPEGPTVWNISGGKTGRRHSSNSLLLWLYFSTRKSKAG
jgi:hypothetical protein